MHATARFDTWLLGRAQDGGVPHLGCDAECCEAARREGRAVYPCCLGVRDRASGESLLIEATPAVEAQVAALHEFAGDPQQNRNPVGGVLLTHAHIGHIAGLLQFGTEVAAADSLPVYCTPRMAAFVRRNAPWSDLVSGGHVDLREITLGGDGRGSFEPLDGLCVEAIQVPHRDEHSDTVAFRLRGPARTLLWVPDIDQWGRPDDLVERLLDGVDVAYVDGTFYDTSECGGRDGAEIPHPCVEDTMMMFADMVASHPGRIQFIHLNHTNPLLRDAARVAEVERRGFGVPEQGHHIPL